MQEATNKLEDIQGKVAILHERSEYTRDMLDKIHKQLFENNGRQSLVSRVAVVEDKVVAVHEKVLKNTDKISSNSEKLAAYTEKEHKFKLQFYLGLFFIAVAVILDLSGNHLVGALKWIF